MQVHSNSKTTPGVRLKIQSSPLSCRRQAELHAVSVSTIQRWRLRQDVRDLSSRPRRLRMAMSEDCRQMALTLRRQGLTLDECLDALVASFPLLKRATLHRFFQREGVSKLSLPKAKRRGRFQDYEPGFIHIDHFYMPPLEGKKRYCFVAIDRATRLAFLKVYDRKTQGAALDFLECLTQAFPFEIHHLLSDNGPEFTNRFYTRLRGGARKPHLLDQFCAQRGIQRRFTKPFTPATNGMAERFIGICKRATVNVKRYPNPKAIEQDLIRWLWIYNNTRKHGGIQRLTPAQKTNQWAKLKPQIFKEKSPENVRNLLRQDT